MAEALRAYPVKKEQQVILKVVQRRVGQREGVRLDRTVPVDLKARDPSEGGNVLILLPDRLPQFLDLNLTRFLGQDRHRHSLALVAVEPPAAARP